MAEVVHLHRHGAAIAVIEMADREGRNTFTRALVAGLGVALVPESARAMHFDGVVLRPLAASGAMAELHLVWRRDSTNPAVPAFRDALVRHFAPGHN